MAIKVKSVFHLWIRVWSQNLALARYLMWRRQWQPTPVLLPGKSHGRRSLVGCSPWGRKSRKPLTDFTFTFPFHALGKEMATHSSVLAWRIPGTGEPGGLPSMGSHRVGHNWSDLAAAAADTWWKWKGEWKSWLKTQHSENEDHGIWSHHFMANRWGNSVRLYFGGLQNHCRWWLQPWN